MYVWEHSHNCTVSEYSLKSVHLPMRPHFMSRWYASLTAEEIQQLFWCIFLDIVGAAPELVVPGPLGDTVDLFWAPIYAFLLFHTYALPAPHAC